MNRSLTTHTFSQRARLNLLLALMSIFSLALCLTRVSYTGSSKFIFLNWNLFLAAVPYGLTTLLVHFKSWRESKFISFLCFLTWLIFFPNAPYILTDIFHLRHSTAAPHWFDLILVLSYAWTGLVYGLLSLLDVEYLLKERVRPVLVDLLVMGLLLISSFGIYLGRFLRLNSWEIVSDPAALFAEISTCLSHPTDHTLMGVTFLMGILLIFIYWSIKMLSQQSSSARL